MTREIKKYHHAAFALLIVLGMNLLIPVAVQAANFFCQIGSGENNTKITQCCFGVESSNTSELSPDQDNIDDCTFIEICEQSISSPLTELRSILPVEEQGKVLFKSNPFSEIDRDYNIFGYLLPDFSITYSTPPIFLLNSTFLN